MLKIAKMVDGETYGVVYNLLFKHLENVPINNRNPLLLKYLIENNVDIPEDFLPMEKYLDFVEMDAKNFQLIPAILLEKEFIYKVLRTNGLCLRYIHNYTFKMCEIAIKQNPAVVRYFKHSKISIFFLEKILEFNIQTINYLKINRLNPECRQYIESLYPIDETLDTKNVSLYTKLTNPLIKYLAHFYGDYNTDINVV